jgi:hypothetical protein
MNIFNILSNCFNKYKYSTLQTIWSIITFLPWKQYKGARNPIECQARSGTVACNHSSSVGGENANSLSSVVEQVEL